MPGTLTVSYKQYRDIPVRKSVYGDEPTAAQRNLGIECGHVYRLPDFYLAEYFFSRRKMCNYCYDLIK